MGAVAGGAGVADFRGGGVGEACVRRGTAQGGAEAIGGLFGIREGFAVVLRSGEGVRVSAQFAEALPEQGGLVEGVGLGGVGGGFPAGGLGGGERFEVGIQGHHGFNDGRGLGDLGEGWERRQGLGVGALEVGHGTVEAGVIGGGARQAEPVGGELRGPGLGGLAEDGGGGRAAMFSVVAMDVDGAIGDLDGLGELVLAFGRDVVVADGEVDVSQAVAAGRFDLGAGAVDGHEGGDTEAFQFGEGRVVLGRTAGEHARGQLVEVMEVGGGEGPGEGVGRGGVGGQRPGERVGGEEGGGEGEGESEGVRRAWWKAPAGLVGGWHGGGGTGLLNAGAG